MEYVDLEELLKEIKDLAEIPAFFGAIKHKIQELKISLSENIHLHREIESMLSKVNEHLQMAQGQIFELTRLGKELWIPSIPNQEDKCDIYAIIPEEIIKYIIKQKMKKRVIKMENGLTLPTLPGRKFDILFEKYNSKYYTGIIKEHGGVKKIVKIENHKGKVDPKEKYRKIKQLNRYLMRNDDYYLHVTSEFDYRWKELMDSEILEDITAK